MKHRAVPWHFFVFWVLESKLVSVLCLISESQTCMKHRAVPWPFFFSFGVKTSICTLPKCRPTFGGFVVILGSFWLLFQVILVAFGVIWGQWWPRPGEAVNNSTTRPGNAVNNSTTRPGEAVKSELFGGSGDFKACLHGTGCTAICCICNTKKTKFRRFFDSGIGVDGH